jgi:dolichol-phosphate mannosyltransferase
MENGKAAIQTNVASADNPSAQSACSGPARSAPSAPAPAPSAPASPVLAPTPVAPARFEQTLYPGHKVLAMFAFWNEADKLGAIIPRLRSGLVDEFIAVDDGSTDDGPEVLRRAGIRVISQPHSGAGAAIKAAVRYGRQNGFDILVLMAGNNKDDPEEIPRLLEPIVARNFDYVQGSRFLPGGSSPHLPLFRRLSIKLLSIFFRAYTWKKCTDLTNGFRAYRLRLLVDPRVDIAQAWLDNYEYEYYVHWKAYTLGYRVTEVPVTKSYPARKGVTYSKIRPFSGWWSMLRPFVLLALRLRR